MKILVLGATGMAGHTITLYFKEKGYDVIAYSRKPFPYCKNIIGDLRDRESLLRILRHGDFDVIINCIGILNQNADKNMGDAIYLNSYLPHLIADTLLETNTKLIHMSTDCVFAGNTGPYYENSFPDGKTIYDRTKALGEIIDNKNLTFRNSIIGPDMNQGGIGLFHWFMNQKEPIRGYTGAIWTGVTTIVLAQAMEAALRENLCGLYNLVNNTSISKYDLLNLFNKYFKNNEHVVNKCDEVKLDKTLYCTRTDFTFTVPSYEIMIIGMKEWILNHKKLYPFYSITENKI